MITPELTFSFSWVAAIPRQYWLCLAIQFGYVMDRWNQQYFVPQLNIRPETINTDQIHANAIKLVVVGVFDWWISESNFWPRPLRIRACVVSTSGFQSNGMETNESKVSRRWQMKYKLDEEWKVNCWLSSWLVELMSDSDDECEEYNDNSVLMEVAVSR